MYEIVEEHEFKEKVKKLFSNYKRFDEITQGIIWILGRDAHKYLIIEGNDNIGCIKSENNEITLYFTIKSKKVHLLDIHHTKEK